MKVERKFQRGQNGQRKEGRQRRMRVCQPEDNRHQIQNKNK